MREHGLQRQQFDFIADKRVPLLPAHVHEGELLIGVEKLRAGDWISLLFQVAESSADPEAPRQQLAWYVLCDNYWKPLGKREIVLDTSNQLLTSGLIQLVIPREATLENSVMPGGLIWIKAAVPEHVEAVSQLIEIGANAVEVRLVEQGNDPTHLELPLPARSIARSKIAPAGVKGVTQPYASFGGRAQESTDTLHMRAAERLRHKDRCVSPWDYERVVLDAFPAIHKVKCVPHAKPGSWLAPGNVLLVVVPDLRNRNARHPLQPKADADTISRIREHVRARAGRQVSVEVKNPTYQRVRLDFKVRLRPGFELNYYAAQIQQALLRALSPWAFEAERTIEFGGRVSRSVMLDLVEELDYVDYVTDFKMFSRVGDEPEGPDLAEVSARTPDAILVSDDTHALAEA
jgi:hypothetical protein